MQQLFYTVYWPLTAILKLWEHEPAEGGEHPTEATSLVY